MSIIATSNGNISLRWKQGQDYLTKIVNNATLSVPHPTKLTSATSWIYDMKQWPEVTYQVQVQVVLLSFIHIRLQYTTKRDDVSPGP